MKKQQNDSNNHTPLEFLEFFAGGGLARLGLGKNWRCAFANDFSPKKAMAYRENFGGAPELVTPTLSASFRDASVNTAVPASS
jgi:site-specific DNA-cytosine methylase